MPEKIPQSFINELLARIDIVDIINSRVRLKKSGNNYQALCPFHNEKTASFSVSQSKQFYYCFGCQAHGNAITFLMEYDRLSYIDAIETLANQVGLKIPKQVSDSNTDNLQPLFTLMQKASRYYQQQLVKAKNAIGYLKARGLSGEISKRFSLGYAPEGWDNLLQQYDQNRDRADLIKSGMIINNDGKSYDRFRNRIIFPIRDLRGRVIAFGARALNDQDMPKYLNSPETPLFHKGQELYGLYEAKQNSSSLPFIILVEGYMDVIALAQHNINNAVATLGTATTTKHIQKLLRYTTKIIFCFDGDTAGKNAAWRALENTLPIMRDGIVVSFLFLPDGEDPDSLVRTLGTEKFNELLNTNIPLSEFFFNHLKRNINLATMDDRAKLAQIATDFLQKMPNGVFRQLMYEKLSKLVHMEITQLDTFANDSPAVRVSTSVSAETPSFLQKAIKMLLSDPQLIHTIENTQPLFDLEWPELKPLINIVEIIQQNPNITTGAILDLIPDQQQANYLAKLAASEEIIGKENLKFEFLDTIKHIYDHSREQTIQDLLNKTSNGDITSGEKFKLQKLIKDAKLKTQLQEITS